MSHLPNFTPKENGVTDEDGAQIIMQCQEWYQARIDEINATAEKLKTCKTIGFEGTTVEDPNFIKGFRSGLLIAVHVLGEFPIKLGEPVDLSSTD